MCAKVQMGESGSLRNSEVYDCFIIQYVFEFSVILLTFSSVAKIEI